MLLGGCAVSMGSRRTTRSPDGRDKNLAAALRVAVWDES